MAKGSLLILEKYPISQNILCARENAVIDLLIKECRCGRGWAEAKTQRLFQTTEMAYGWLQTLVSGVVFVRRCVIIIQFLFSNVKAMDDAMRVIIHEHPTIENQLRLLQTIPGIGEYSAITCRPR